MTLTTRTKVHFNASGDAQVSMYVAVQQYAKRADTCLTFRSICRYFPPKTFLAANFVFLSFTLLFSLGALAAENEGICQANDFQVVETNDSTTVLLKDFEVVKFSTLGKCDIAGSCQYEIVAQNDYSKRVIVDEVEIRDICSAFQKTTKTVNNRYKNSSYYVLGRGFDNVTVVSYKLVANLGEVELAKTFYHRRLDKFEPGIGEVFENEVVGFTETYRVSAQSSEITVFWKDSGVGEVK